MSCVTESLAAFRLRIRLIRRGPLKRVTPEPMAPFVCPFCDGTGFVFDLGVPCQRCDGSGQLDTWDACRPYTSEDYNGHCGGCDECLLMQATHHAV